MKEQINTPGYEATPFRDGDRIDTHIGRDDLLSLDEVRRQRQRTAFERTALGLSAAASELAPTTPHERIGAMSVNLAQFRREAQQSDDFEAAA